MKKSIFVSILAVVLGIVALAQNQQSQTLPTEMQTLTREWAKTINEGNLEGWLALHTENIDYADYSYWVGKSREEMRRWGQAVIGAGGRFTITEARMQGGNLVWLLEYRDRGFSNQSRGVVTVTNGRISKLVIGSR